MAKSKRPPQTKTHAYCTKCNQYRPIDDFCLKPHTMVAKYVCRPCEREKNQAYYLSNRESILAQNKEYRDSHVEEYCQSRALYYRSNRELISAKTKVKYQTDLQFNYETKRRSVRWQRENPERYRLRLNRYCKERETRDVSFKLARRLRARIKHALKKGSDTKKFPFVSIVGCGVEEVRLHLESLWQPGMTWENWGTHKMGGPKVWHIDHIRPCASFDLTDPEQQKACFHYTNLQPLWATDNLTKYSHYENKQD